MIGLRDHFSREADTRCISTIGITELLIGAEKSNRPAETRRKIDRFTARLVVLPVDNARAQRFRYCIANQFLNDLPRSTRASTTVRRPLTHHSPLPPPGQRQGLPENSPFRFVADRVYSTGMAPGSCSRSGSGAIAAGTRLGAGCPSPLRPQIRVRRSPG